MAILAGFALFTRELKTPESHRPGFTTKILVLVAEGFLASTAIGYAFSKREGDIAGAFVMAWFLFVSSSSFRLRNRSTLMLDSGSLLAPG